jgi:hypothetical protein
MIASPAAVGVDDVDPDLLAICQRRHDRAQCTRGAALASDYPSEVFLVNAHLEGIPAAAVLGTDFDVLRGVDNAADKVFERFCQQFTQPRWSLLQPQRGLPMPWPSW